jgi:bifunctional UDP-N-acetylglucosamine pyrophosphorylase/glucosamine-1-phosphate N-acetyltransferase
MHDHAAIILAAGKSTRMKTRVPKVLHHLSGKPLIDYVLDAVDGAHVEKKFLVVGFENEKVREHVGERVTFVEQRELRGTGHAVQQVAPLIEGLTGNILILCGDMPLITADLLCDFIASHEEKKAPLSLLSAVVEGESDFGRIIRNQDGIVERIVEYRDATPAERALREVNLSIYLFSAPHLLQVLPLLTMENVQKELYLTDTVLLTREMGLPVHATICGDPDAARGVNSRHDLPAINDIMRKRIISRLMDEGVTFVDPATCHIDSSAMIGMDTIIHPFTFIEGAVIIGGDCVIGPMTTIKDAALGSRVTVTHSIVVGSTVGDDTSIGPFAYVRPDNVIGKKVKIGDFVELKKSTIGDGTKVPHLSYVGDATLGEKVNIGAGTITCNYDGVKKNQTFIDDGTHIGSNTNLVAPVKVGKHAVTGAGAVVTEDVPDYALVIGVPAKIKKFLNVTTPQ